MIGILLSLLTALLFGISVAIFKHSMKAHTDFSVRDIARNKVWLGGLVIGLMGVVAYVFAMALESKGFGYDANRTSYLEIRMRKNDCLLMIVTLAIMIGAIYLKYQSF